MRIDSMHPAGTKRGGKHPSPAAPVTRNTDRSKAGPHDAEPAGNPAAADERLDPARVAALYVEHGPQLRAFLWGVLRDEHRAGDAMQAAFVKLLEQGHTARDESLKSWLFRVAWHEALVIRRREAVGSRAHERLARQAPPAGESAAEGMIRHEALRQVQRAVENLPQTQKDVLRLRVYEQMKFTDVASALGVPLGTALARMRAALIKLRQILDHES
jgi:RNA polymerase sigma-70 factor (ECF subfamily)